MPKGMQAIYSQTFAGAGQLNFNNIPQNYTDLKVVVSQRNGSANNYEPMAFRFNSTEAIYSNTSGYGDGSAPASGRSSANAYLSYNGGLSVNGGNSTANVFGSYELYIPNYTSSSFKQVIIDSVTENIGNSHCNFGAGLYRSNLPITFLQVGGYTVAPVSGSTVTIYGISR